MAGFCTRCGRPLPEDGKCPFCAPAQPQQQPQQPYQQPVYTQQAPVYTQPPAGYAAPAQPQPQQPSAFAQMIKRYFAFLGAYIKSPVDALRRVEEDRDMGPALINAALLLTLTFFSALITALYFRPSYGLFHADFAWGMWLVVTFVQPVFGLGTGVGGTLLTQLVGKERTNFRSVLATVGASAVLPVAVLAAMMLLQFLGSWFYNALWILVLIAAAVALLVLLTKVYRVKMNFWQILVLCGVLLVGYLLLTSVQDGFISAIYSYY